MNLIKSGSGGRRAMPGPEMDLKRELFEAGNRLLRPPSSVDELLALLDRVEHCLSLVEQQPPVGIQDALCPSFKALITPELLKHPDIDVRVGVTACLTEISRITAPEVPYNDDLMKEVFRLIISSFEGLSDNSSKSFSKRVVILETVARVRACAVLLDLESDGLVVEMFQNFYKSIRDFHTDNVFASMESIMTLVIEESEAISTDLLFALLSILKKENKDALPIAMKLGEKVVRNCATKLKACIVEAIKSLRINLLDYDFVVTLACQITRDHNPLAENILSVPLVNGSESGMGAVEDVDVAQVVVAEAVPNLPSNGHVEYVENGTQGMMNSSDNTHSTVVVSPAETILDQIQPGQGAPGSEIAMNPVPAPLSKSEPKSEKIAKKRGRKPKNSKDIMQTDSSKFPQTDGNKESSDVNTGIELDKAPPEDSSGKPNIPENKSDSSNKCLSPKVMENNAVTSGSPSLTDILPLKSSSKRIRRSKKVTSTHADSPDTPSHQSPEKNASDGHNDTETRLVGSEKDTPDGSAGVASKLVSLVEVKMQQNIEGESEDNPPKQPGTQLGVNDGTQRTKKRGRPRKDASMSPATGTKDGVSLKGTSKKRPRHRFTSPEDGREYGEELVGSRIKVWWPEDKEYYDGIVEYFDSVKKKHKILYSDNEMEVLNLNKEKWTLVKSCAGSQKDGVACHTNAGDGSDAQQIKRLKTDSDSVGILGNTDTPPKRRRGRPPKNATALANYGSTSKGSSKPDGENKSDKSKIASMADDGNHAKSMDSVAKCGAIPNLNAELENSEQDAPENDSTRAKEDSTVGTDVMDTIAPKAAAVGLDINEPFTLGDLKKTATPESGNSNVDVTEEVKSDPSAISKTEGANQKISASGTAIKPRKRKARTSSNSSSPSVPVSADAPIKRRRGRPSKVSLRTSDEKSIDLSKQLGDPKVDDSSGGYSDNLVVVKPEDSLVEGQNVPYMSAEHKVSDHGVVDNLATKSAPDSMVMGTKGDVALAQNSSKSTTGELKSGSSTLLKPKLKTSGSEPKLRRRRVIKTTSSPSEQVNKDGSVKRPRGRPCKPKVEAPKSSSKPEGSRSRRAVREHKADDSASEFKPDAKIIHKTEASFGNVSGLTFKNDTPDMSSHIPADVAMKDKQDDPKIADNIDTLSPKIGNNSVADETGDLKLGLTRETKGDDTSMKSTESGTFKEKMTTTGSSKEQLSEANTAYEGDEKPKKKRSRKPKGGEVFFS